VHQARRADDPVCARHGFGQQVPPGIRSHQPFRRGSPPSPRKEVLAWQTISCRESRSLGRVHVSTLQVALLRLIGYGRVTCLTVVMLAR
jgi:hypothetical protein